MFLRPPNIASWGSHEHNTERIISFNASWFTVGMATSILVGVINHLPYSASWLQKLGYCFWVLTILLYLLFLSCFLTRCVLFPYLTKQLFKDFYQTSYLGALPVTLGNIAAGIVTYYNDRPAAVWVALGLFYVVVAIDLLLASVVVFLVVAYQDPHEIECVTGVWLISFIPLVVTSSVGADLLPYLDSVNAATVLIISFLLWSVGECMCLIIITLYFWRLVRHQLPMREAIVSCFIPAGPLATGSFAIRNLSVGLAAFIEKESFIIQYSPTAAAAPIFFDAVCEMIRWIGLLVSLLLTAFSTFWLIQAVGAVLVKAPKQFNVGFWAFVFPMGVYTTSVSYLAQDLRNAGFRGYAATCAAVTGALWLFCALMTFYKAVWCGELFFAPGLEGWTERHAIEEAKAKAGAMPSLDGGELEMEQAEEGRGARLTERVSRLDGTYHISGVRSRRKANGHP